MARAMQWIGFAVVASADMGPSARQLRGYSANSTSKLSANDAYQGLGQPCRWGNEGIEYGYCADGLQCYRPTSSSMAPEGAGLCIRECSSWGSPCSGDSPTYGTTCECLGSGGEMFCGNPAVRWSGVAQKCFWPSSYLPTPSSSSLQGLLSESANSTSKLSANDAYQGLGQPCRWGNEGIEYGYCADGLQCYRPTSSSMAPKGAGLCIKECSSWGSPCGGDSPTYGTTCECLGSGGEMFCGNPAVRWSGDAQKCFWPSSYLPTPAPTPAPARLLQCESLSQTNPAPCPRVQGGSGAYINTDKTCVYNRGCITGTVSQNCFEQTGCQYKP